MKYLPNLGLTIDADSFLVIVALILAVREVSLEAGPTKALRFLSACLSWWLRMSVMTILRHLYNDSRFSADLKKSVDPEENWR
jgi:hypothetical protein